MSVHLCIDWGNTNIKAAIFNDNRLVKHLSIAADKVVQQLADVVATHHPERSILCSVVEITNEVMAALQKNLPGLLVVDNHTKVPINNAYGSPESLGADRLAMVVAAHVLYPENNNLVECAGTCVTYNFIQKSRTFRGGAISPGLKMRLQAMHHFTGKLPDVPFDEDAMLMGYDTASCMQSGAAHGLVHEIDGMIQAYAANYADFNAILTGGDAPFFANKIKSKIFADPDLLFKGLNIILNSNA